jgi:hypothetical protein
MRLGRWLMWSVAFSLVPFAAVVLIRRVDSGALPGMSAIFGSGQLLLTSAALLGGGVRELASASDKNFWSEFFTWSATIFLFAIAAMYGYAVKEVAIQKQVTHQSDVVTVSLVLFAISILVAGASIGVTNPSKSTTDGST